MVRSAKWSVLNVWAMKIAKHRGLKRAKVALASKLAVVLQGRPNNDGERD